MKYSIILLLLSVIVSCKQNSADEKKDETPDSSLTTSAEQNNTDKGAGKINDPESENSSFKKVVNERFDFSFEIPGNWSAIDKSNNGDGFYIDCGNASVDLRIYGETIEGNELMAEMELNSCVRTEDFKFGNGYPGIICYQDPDEYYYYDTPKTRIVYYIHADKKWKEQNASVINSIAKSIASGQTNFN